MRLFLVLSILLFIPVSGAISINVNPTTRNGYGLVVSVTNDQTERINNITINFSIPAGFRTSETVTEFHIAELEPASTIQFVIPIEYPQPTDINFGVNIYGNGEPVRLNFFVPKAVFFGGIDTDKIAAGIVSIGLFIGGIALLLMYNKKK